MLNSKFECFKEFMVKGDFEGVKNNFDEKFTETIFQNFNRWRPIHFACSKGNIDILKLLIGHNCDIESADEDGWRPIHFACEYGYIEIVKLLIDQKCDIESADEYGWRPIHCSCRNGHFEIVKYLIDKKCKIESKDKDKRRPIHYACFRDHVRIVKLLINKNCNIESKDKDKRRPIHFACLGNYIEILKLLIALNCNIECEDNDGKKPIHYASENGHVDIAILLTETKFRKNASKYDIEFQHIRILGKGSFGVVFEAQHRIDQMHYAVKRICFRYSIETQRKMLKEVQLFAKLQHPGICRYYQAWFEYPSAEWQKTMDKEMGLSEEDINSGAYSSCFPCSDLRDSENASHDVVTRKKCTYVYLYISMELYKRESLKEWLEKPDEHRDERTKLLFFVQIVDAVAYIHKKGLIHRDLKPSNILFDDQNHIRIVDFGLATSICRNQTATIVSTDKHSLNDMNEVYESVLRKPLTKNVGTLLYMSPEQHGCQYNQKVDIFALGVIFIELTVPLGKERVEILTDIRSGRFESQIFQAFHEQKEFAKLLMNHNPEIRPSCEKILEHEILTNVVAEAIEHGMINMGSFRHFLSLT